MKKVMFFAMMVFAVSLSLSAQQQDNHFNDMINKRNMADPMKSLNPGVIITFNTEMQSPFVEPSTGVVIQKINGYALNVFIPVTYQIDNLVWYNRVTIIDDDFTIKAVCSNGKTINLRLTSDVKKYTERTGIKYYKISVLAPIDFDYIYFGTNVIFKSLKGNYFFTDYIYGRIENLAF